MAVLANCWLIIEIFLIPNGFKKWFYLSFYIHPFFLFFCQIFLWIKTLKKCIFFVIFFVNRYIFSHVFGVLRRFLIKTRSLFGSGDGNDTEVGDSDEDLWYEVSDSFRSLETGSGILFLRYEAGGSCEITKIPFYDVGVHESVDQETVSECSSSDLDDERSSSCSGANFFSMGITRRDMEVISHVSSSSSGSSEEDHEAVKPEEEKEEEEKDSFYKSYTERMSWFDLLNQERMCGLKAFLSKKPCSNGEKRILKSLESDIEMVYVAQTCLSWEALHHQYRKLEAMVASASADTTCTSGGYGALITCTLATKFQRFQILLDRFMEDERSEKGKRYWNFIQKRSSLKTLLQVPDISENVDNENERMMIRATDVLKAIEKCMKIFKSFIEVDEKKPWWRASGGLSWSHSPLEDPRDSNLLHDLTRTLRQNFYVEQAETGLFHLHHHRTRRNKKELWMKDLKGKTRCWLRRRVEHLGDVQNKEMMFAMIELKLVARVLMMSLISTSQLHWCQQKLDNIQISHGRITRSYTGSLLFPPS